MHRDAGELLGEGVERGGARGLLARDQRLRARARGDSARQHRDGENSTSPATFSGSLMRKV